MVRSQISLDSELHKKAKQRAAALGISLAEYLRHLVSRDLQDPTPEGDISAIFDLGHSGGSDVASDERKYLDAAVESDYLRGAPAEHT